METHPPARVAHRALPGRLSLSETPLVEATVRIPSDTNAVLAAQEDATIGTAKRFVGAMRKEEMVEAFSRGHRYANGTERNRTAEPSRTEPKRMITREGM